MHHCYISTSKLSLRTQGVLSHGSAILKVVVLASFTKVTKTTQNRTVSPQNETLQLYFRADRQKFPQRNTVCKIIPNLTLSQNSTTPLMDILNAEAHSAATHIYIPLLPAGVYPQGMQTKIPCCLKHWIIRKKNLLPQGEK